MHRVLDQAMQAANSGPPRSASAIPKGDHSGALGPNQEGDHAPRQSASNSCNPIHDRIAQLDLRIEEGK
jgi:hypothetical protein